MRSLQNAMISSCGGCLALLEHDEGLDRLAAVGVGHADDRCFFDLGVLKEHRLDVGGIDVKAAGDDHVLLAVGHVKVAIRRP